MRKGIENSKIRNHADASAHLRIKKLPDWIDIYGVKRVEVARTRGIEQVEMAAQLKIGTRILWE